MNKSLDTTGLSCPQPVLEVKKALDAQSEGTLVVLTDSKISRENITRFARSRGWNVTLTEEMPERFVLTLQK